MSITYVNGDFLPEDQAKISIFDRGFIFGDGIYEAISVVDGKLLDSAPHLARLSRSLGEISLTSPLSNPEIIDVLKELIVRAEFTEGLLYFQITRGAAPRTFHFPPSSVNSSFVAFCMPMALIDRVEVTEGVKVISIPEQRWKRRDIKSTSLLPQCLGKQIAHENNAFEALMIEEGMITEGTSASAYIIKDSTIITRPLSNDILPGVTRRAILSLAEIDGIKIEERLFSLEEAYQADEVCITAASIFILPVIKIDNNTIANGKPGPVVARLRELYIKEALAAAI